MLPTTDGKCPTCPDDWADGRWSCSSSADWLDGHGHAPWGDNDSASGWLLYLSGMDDGEHRWLSRSAFEQLDNGSWQGCATPHGGWEDGEPWNEKERQWRLTARGFYERYSWGKWELTEGLLFYATYDLCCELAWFRRWCPRANCGA